ncbi:MAG: polysaccharide deacetylase family protein [Nostocaceae cyanobacterium]|nr:polysaccharide deacetylase family protein [Nostocaceae cyanobacterium]
MKTAKKMRLFVIIIFALFSTGGIMNFHKLTNFFGVNRVDTQEKIVALTYDDGPNPPYTNQLLDVLDRYKAKATFFAIGENIAKHPDIVKLTEKSGSELANHSYSHPDMLFKPDKFLKSEIEKTDSILQELGVKHTIHFRPPWGRRFIGLPYIIYQQNKKLIMWDIDSQDYFDEHTPSVIANRVIERIRPGAIVVMHDGGGDRSRTVIATEMIIKSLQPQGYEFKTVSELLAISD